MEELIEASLLQASFAWNKYCCTEVKPGNTPQPRIQSNQDSKPFQPIRTLHSINGSWSQSRKTWHKDVIASIKPLMMLGNRRRLSFIQISISTN